MSERHTYRVIVRGTWDGLTEEARARLVAEAAGHGMDSMRFTEEGTLSYEPRPLKHFSRVSGRRRCPVYFLDGCAITWTPRGNRSTSAHFRTPGRKAAGCL